MRPFILRKTFRGSLVALSQADQTLPASHCVVGKGDDRARHGKGLDTGRSSPASKPVVRTHAGGTAAKIRAKKIKRAVVRAAKAAERSRSHDGEAVEKGAELDAGSDEELEPGEIRVPSASTPCSASGIPDSTFDVPNSTPGDTASSAPGDTASSTPGDTASITTRGEKLYYRIYNTNYGEQRVTVGPSYVATKQMWHIARIIDRRLTSRGLEYRVLWLSGRCRSRRYYQRTWEPKHLLEDDDFVEEISLVDRWKLSKVERFDGFCKADEFGKRTIAADMDGLCLFSAFKKAAELAGRPDIVTDEDISSFVEFERQHYKLDLTKGTSWKLFLVFLRWLRDCGRDFVFNDLTKINFAIPGRRGARLLEEVRLLDGLYLVAAYNHQFVGHAFVLVVPGGHRRVFDDGDEKPVAAMTWINFICFIRPFIVFERK